MQGLCQPSSRCAREFRSIEDRAITRSALLAVIPEAVARRDAKHGVLRVLPYRFGQKLESYGSLVPKDRPLSKPTARFRGRQRLGD